MRKNHRAASWASEFLKLEKGKKGRRRSGQDGRRRPGVSGKPETDEEQANILA
jgi:hypothetical protein